MPRLKELRPASEVSEASTVVQCAPRRDGAKESGERGASVALVGILRSNRLVVSLSADGPDKL